MWSTVNRVAYGLRLTAHCEAHGPRLTAYGDREVYSRRSKVHSGLRGSRLTAYSARRTPHHYAPQSVSAHMRLI